MRTITKRQSGELTERDVEVICDLYRYRYLSSEQVARLHFQSQQTANRRLRFLLSQDYLKFFTVPAIPERIFGLAKAGAEIVAEHLSVESSDLRWSHPLKVPRDHYFMKHFLQVTDFRINLANSAQKRDIKLLGFIPEYYTDKTDHGKSKKHIRDFIIDAINPSERLSHTPDGVFALEKDAKSALFFLEMDRGTETVSSPDKGVLKALKFYLNYWNDGKYQRYREDFECGEFKGFRVLLVTTSPVRIENIREACTKLYVSQLNLKQFIWLAGNDDLQKDSVLRVGWVSADISDHKIYQIE